MSASAASSVKKAGLPGIANTVLVIGLGLALASLSMKLLSGQSETSTDNFRPLNTQAAVGSGAAATSPLEHAQTIASVHLFGDAAKKIARVEAPKRQEPIVDTRLNLQLAGVFAFEPAENAIAIISSGSAEQNAYGVGDKISGDISLEAVYPDHVILRNKGKLEKLSLPDNVQPIAMAPAQQASAAQPSQQAQFDQPTIELPSNPRQLRDTLARNPSMLGRVVAAEPYQENGKLVGYRITPKQNPEILEAQGIVAGDVITRVNNIQLNSQKQGIRALRNAVKAENLDVVVLRDGIEIPISISLAQ